MCVHPQVYVCDCTCLCVCVYVCIYFIVNLGKAVLGKIMMYFIFKAFKMIFIFFPALLSHN